MPVPDWLSDDGQWSSYLDTAKASEPWSTYPDEFFTRLRGVSRRGRLVAWRIFEDGQTTTELLATLYDYSHSPRAARDIKDCGIRIESGRGRHSRTHRPIAIYTFADKSRILMSDAVGRSALPHDFVATVFAAADHQCALCAGRFHEQFLQADHRIPYAIVGEAQDQAPLAADFMAVCRSCNRAKSWTCEHCPNWVTRDPNVCATCYWASPSDYDHIALVPRRELRLVWLSSEVAEFDRANALAAQFGQDLPDWIKELIRQAVMTGYRPRKPE